MPNGRTCRLLAARLALAASPALAVTYDAGVALGGPSANSVTISPGASSYDACVKAENGQVRIADERGCLPSELPISLRANVAPLEVNRFLTIPEGSGGMFSGIFGGLLCPAGRTLVSGGFKVLYDPLEIVESFIGPGFGLPRVYIVLVKSVDNGAVPAGNMAQMWATCL